MYHGIPLGHPCSFQSTVFILLQAIVLDISSVGTGSGLATRLLCQDIVERFPGLDLISGGGIRTEQEIEELADEQFLSGLLVASLIHQGKLSPALVHRLNAGT